MSKTSEKAGWVSGLVVMGVLALLPALPVCASVDQPDATNLFGNAYHDGGWFSCGTSRHSDGYLLFDAKDDFVLSPRYPAPVRKIVLSVRCTSKSPTKLLLLCPFVGGVESADMVVTNSTVANVNTKEILTVDFPFADNVDAFRLLLGGSGSTGNWGVDAIVVFYGEKTADEDAIFRQFAQQLPTPEDLTLTALTSSSLSLSASNVTDAVEYCFELTKLTGCPRTEIREDFASWTERLSEGWGFGETNAVKLSSYSGSNSSSVDRGAEDCISLRIEKKDKAGDVARVEILSPKAPAGEFFRECSFWCKRSSGESSEQIAVYGTSGDLAEWRELDEPTPVTTTGTVYRTTIPDDLNVNWVKFVFTASVSNCPNCALDSLCVVYGGNEARELVSALTNATPTAAWRDLESGRYGYRVKALGATEGELQFKDSAWSEEQIVDLSWADVSLSQPENLAYEVSGDKLNLSWSPVAMADHYEVKVALVDDPENPVATLTTRSASASVPLAELGDYVVTVTAVSPGGVSTASSTLENCTAALGKVTELEVEATAADTISANWKAVPLAESYQAKLFKVTGTAGSVTYGWTSEGERIVLPEDWEHEEEWEGDSWKSGTKNPVCFPSLAYAESYIASAAFPAAVTKLIFNCKCGSTANGALENSRLCIYVAGEDGVWGEEPVVRQELLTSLQKVELPFALSDGVRRIKFQAEGESKKSGVNVALGEVTVSYGEYVRTEVASVGTTECKASYSGLDKTAKYVVVVTPQPSEGSEYEEASVIIDLATEYFRPSGPVSIAGLRGGVYLQSFDALAYVTKEADLRRVPLENWQFFKGSGEAEKLYYTSGTNSTTGGVYCYSDAERTTDSFMIGTVAVKTTGSSVGLAFVNDTGSSLGAPTLTFTALRRNEKPGDSYRLEWLVTDGPWSIGTESDGWQSLPLKEGEPGFSVKPDCRLASGQVIIFRWRQEKVTGGPMLGLDDVHVEFPVDKPGFTLHLR